MTRQATTLSSIFEHERFDLLDTVAEALQGVAQAGFRAGGAGPRLKSWLNGTPLRHRVHPALVAWPLGAWTTAAFLDAREGRASRVQRAGYRAAADSAIAFGIVGVLPSVLAGVADWVDTYDHPRRVGVAHASLNTLALACYSASFLLRQSGSHGRGKAKVLSSMGMAALVLGGALGGELVYTLGVNVPYTLYPKAPDEFRDVLASEQLVAGKPVVVELERVPVLLVRSGQAVYAVQEWCPHAGGPLSEGAIDGEVVECPWHQSRFCLRDGAPTQGPAAVPLRTFEMREANGRISLRPSFEGQSWPPAPKPPRTEPEVVAAK